MFKSIYCVEIFQKGLLAIMSVILLLVPVIMVPPIANAQSATLNVSFSAVPGRADTYSIEGSVSAGGVGNNQEARVSVYYQYIRPGQSFGTLPDNMNRSCS